MTQDEARSLKLLATRSERGYQRLSALLEQAPLVAWIKTATGEYCYVNQGLCTHLGLPPDDILWRTDFELLPTPLALRAHQIEAEVLKQGRPFESSERLISKTGAQSTVRMVRFQISDDDGQDLIGGVGVETFE